MNAGVKPRVQSPIDNNKWSSSSVDVSGLSPESDSRDYSEEYQTTSASDTSSREQQAPGELAMLFTIQEERCLSEVSREGSKLSKASLTSSQLSEVTFIYQHIDFQVLSKCVPAFVKSHLNKNGRYLPETFILRVNYWRRRRAVGEDSTAKKASKETSVRPCNEQGSSSPRDASAVSPGSHTAISRHATSIDTRSTVITV